MCLGSFIAFLWIVVKKVPANTGKAASPLVPLVIDGVRNSQWQQLQVIAYRGDEFRTPLMLTCT